MYTSFHRYIWERRSVSTPSNITTPQTEIIEASDATPVFEGPDFTISSHQVGNWKRKRSIEQPNYIISVCDLLPLQQEVICKQMEILSAELQLIEEQREYDRPKKQRRLEKIIVKYNYICNPIITS